MVRAHAKSSGAEEAVRAAGGDGGRDQLGAHVARVARQFCVQQAKARPAAASRSSRGRDRCRRHASSGRWSSAAGQHYGPSPEGRGGAEDADAGHGDWRTAATSERCKWSQARRGHGCRLISRTRIPLIV